MVEEAGVEADAAEATATPRAPTEWAPAATGEMADARSTPSGAPEPSGNDEDDENDEDELC